MLERDGEEVARATSVVRYAPNSSFDPHTHGGGEEFFVLDGVFSDEHGDFGPGMYVRNPPGSRHTPRSAKGCTILVKLRQMDPEDQDTCASTPPRRPGSRAGRGGERHAAVRVRERVALLKLAPGTRLGRHEHPGGEETFVLEGALEDELGRYPKGAWLRNPPAARTRRSATRAASCTSRPATSG